MGKTSKSTRVAARLALADRDAGLAQRMASLLRDLGFQIEQVSPHGVSFAGPAELFESVVHSHIRPSDKGFTFEAAPQLPDAVAEAGSSVYLPTRPDYFP